MDYPSAAKALEAADRRVGIAGASVITACNPAGSNWEVWVVRVADRQALMTACMNAMGHSCMMAWSVFVCSPDQNNLCGFLEKYKRVQLQEDMPVLAAGMLAVVPADTPCTVQSCKFQCRCSAAYVCEGNGLSVNLHKGGWQAFG